MRDIELIDRVCPICHDPSDSRLDSEANINLEGLDQFAFASRKLPEYMHWRLMNCNACDLLYASPAPSVDQLSKLYTEADFSSREEAALASNSYGMVLKTFVDNLPDRDCAVDIGTGDGIFLNELLDIGFKHVLGIEPSLAPIQVASDRVKLFISQGMFQKDTLKPDSQTLVTCFQTIEHLSNPLEFCQDAYRALKPGGALLLVGHNRRSFSARLLGKKSPIYDIEHLQLFSFPSVKKLLQAAGFQSVEVHRLYNRYPLRYWVQLFPFPRPIKLAIMKALGFLNLAKILIPLPAGNMYAVGIKNGYTSRGQK